MQHVAGADADRLEQFAAEQYLFSGRLDEGSVLFVRSLRRQGIRLPSTTAGAAAWLMVERARLRLRGLEFRQRPPDPAASEQLARLEISACALGQFDGVCASALFLRHLRLALDAGDAAQVALGLDNQLGQCLVGVGDAAAIPDLLARIEALLTRVDAPNAQTNLHLYRGRILMWAPEPDLEGALAEFDTYLARRSALFQRDTWFDRANAQQERLGAMVLLGRLAEVARELPPLLDAAWEREAFTVLAGLASGLCTHALIAVGALDDAEREFARASVVWSSSKGQYSVPDLNMLVAAVSLALARGEPEAAWERAQRDLSRLLDSPTRSMELVGGLTRAAIVRAGLATAACTTGAERAQAMRMVKRVLPKCPSAARWAASVTLANLEGGRQEVLALVHERLAYQDGARQPRRNLTRSIERRACGLLLGGEEGAVLVAEADAFLRAGGCVDPAHFSDVMTPGIQPQ
jgi:hypothetical protein